LPSYLSLALHIDLYKSFLYTSLPWLVATICDLVVGGWLVDSLIRRGFDASRVRQIVLICGTAFGLGILGAAKAHSTAQALIWISVSIGGLVGGGAGRLVDSVADREPRKRGTRGRHSQFFESAVGHCSADHHGLFVLGDALVCVGIWGGGHLSCDWDHGVHRFAGQD
jgi:hypothetical protein